MFDSTVTAMDNKRLTSETDSSLRGFFGIDRSRLRKYCSPPQNGQAVEYHDGHSKGQSRIIGKDFGLQ